MIGAFLCLLASNAQAHGPKQAADGSVELLYQEGLRLQLVCGEDMRYSITQHADIQHQHHAQSEDSISTDWVERHCLASMVRRHLLQHAPTIVPTDAELSAHLQQHRAFFATAQRYDFEQRYFRDQQPDQSQIDALNNGRTVTSIPHSLGEQFRELDYAGIQQRFGVGFATAVQRQTVGVWAGPVRSALGWHALRVHKIEPEQFPSLQKLRPRLLEHWRQQQREHWLQSQIKALAADH
ncbi:MAG: peptidyl-prolyl cis-trans isomerase [Oceanococcus sp.]